MPNQHLGRQILDKIKDHGDNTAFRYKTDEGWVSVSYTEFGKKIHRLVCALIKADVLPGERIGIYSANRYEWAVTDFACIISGAVSVPIYATNTGEQARFIIQDAGIKLIFTGNAIQYENIAAIRTPGNSLDIVTYDADIDLNTSFACDFSSFLDLKDSDRFLPEIESRLENIKSSDTSTIIYTSGTTGNPKGVMLTNDNFFHQFNAIEQNFDVSKRDTSLCFLPLSHVYERMWSYYVYLKGAINTYLEDPKQIIETLAEVRPTAMVSVPRLYEKIYATVMNRLETASVLKKLMFKKALETGDRYYNTLKEGKFVPFGLSIKHKIFDKLVLSKIREVVGGPKNFFSAGGAPLEQSIEEFFFSCGLLICQGYGLTETSPMISYNTPGCFKFGTVGKPVPDCNVRIAGNGEVQVKGPQVMKGYYNQPEKTAEVMDNGWFKTGDVGEFDADGFLKITDRIKDLIITSGGKNIAPQHIETLIGKDFFIEQILAIGDRRKFISALVVPSFEALETWAQKKQIPYTSMEDLVKHPDVIAFFQKRITYHSKPLAQYETIKKFRLLSNAFTVETGEITPTLKMKRKNINEKYKEIIDSMYEQD